jgi:exopolyphosphatase/guanosine-5'-triphosphate,3'-diphosphate pyrophosphatase
LRKALIEAGHVDKLKLAGLPEDRQHIFAGGVAILLGAFDTFGLKSMMTSVGALREGVLYDLLGRISHEDVRDNTIRRISERYHIDQTQAARIETTALSLLRQVAKEWDLNDETSRRFLAWASRLHEIGLSISFTGYQKHSAYIVAHADLPGFSQEDQNLLSALIMGHRRKLTQAYFQSLPDGMARDAMRLCVLLRLAARLHRSRSPGPPPDVELSVKKGKLEIGFPAGWLLTRPLTAADLEDEKQRLQEAGFELTFR